ncbi:MAG: S1-like domain-containing RNA-binding protein [Bacteroidota bacterium]
MPDLGYPSRLQIIKHLDFGMYLQAGEDEILIPTQYIPEGVQIGDYIDVFLYRDSEDRVIATTLEPAMYIGEVEYLEAVSVVPQGAFMEWGLPKDLLVPFREQETKIVEGMVYPVYLYLDEQTQRLAGSTRLSRFIKNDELTVEEGEEVQLLILNPTDLGYNALINNKHFGLIYENEVFKPLQSGMRMRGFIKKIREDNKIDLSLQPKGYAAAEEGTTEIRAALKKAGGFLPLHDKSEPEEIYNALKMSKKVFKKAIGALYKSREILLEQGGIRAVSED